GYTMEKSASTRIHKHKLSGREVNSSCSFKKRKIVRGFDLRWPITSCFSAIPATTKFRLKLISATRSGSSSLIRSGTASKRVTFLNIGGVGRKKTRRISVRSNSKRSSERFVYGLIQVKQCYRLSQV